MRGCISYELFLAVERRAGLFGSFFFAFVLRLCDGFGLALAGALG